MTVWQDVEETKIRTTALAKCRKNKSRVFIIDMSIYAREVSRKPEVELPEVKAIYKLEKALTLQDATLRINDCGCRLSR